MISFAVRYGDRRNPPEAFTTIPCRTYPIAVAEMISILLKNEEGPELLTELMKTNYMRPFCAVGKDDTLYRILVIGDAS